MRSLRGLEDEPGQWRREGRTDCTAQHSGLKGHALLKFLRHEEEQTEEFDKEPHFTGKVAALIFDRFGDFEGFMLEDRHGGEHRFDSREHEIEHLIRRAWEERVMATVLTRRHSARHAVSIILRGPPPHRP